MASQNIDQIYVANPATSMQSTDLLYIGRSPFNTSDDFAITWSNLESSITTVGTIGTGTWQGSLITGTYGGTGVNNGASTITIGGNVTYSGAYTFTGALTGATSITFPTSGTLSTTTTLITGTYGGTGVNNGASTITIGGNVTYSGAYTFTGTLTGATSVTYPTSGTLATTSQLPTLPLSVSNGGTGESSVTTAATATAWAGWDSNSNLNANNFNSGYATTAASASTVTLTVSSAANQFFTGNANQTVVMPVTSTLALGMKWRFWWVSYDTLTIQSSGGNTIQSCAGPCWVELTCILTSGTTASSWVAYGAQQSLYVGSATTFGSVLVDGYLLADVSFGNGTTTVATSGGTTAYSTPFTIFTGSTTQTFTLFDTSNIGGVGFSAEIFNTSSGSITINTHNASNLLTLSTNTAVRCINNTTANNNTSAWMYFTKAINS